MAPPGPGRSRSLRRAPRRAGWPAAVVSGSGRAAGIWPALYTGKQRPDGAGGVAAEQRSWLGGSGGRTMTSGISLVAAGAGAAAASSAFTWTDAVVIFVVAVVLLTAGVALVAGEPGCWSTGRGCGPRTAGGSAGPPSRTSRRSSATPGCTAAGLAAGRPLARRKIPAISRGRAPPARLAGEGRRAVGVSSPSQRLTRQPQQMKCCGGGQVGGSGGSGPRVSQAGSGLGATPASRARSARPGCRSRCPRRRRRTGPPRARC